MRSCQTNPASSIVNSELTGDRLALTLTEMLIGFYSEASKIPPSILPLSKNKALKQGCIRAYLDLLLGWGWYRRGSLEAYELRSYVARKCRLGGPQAKHSCDGSHVWHPAH